MDSIFLILVLLLYVIILEITFASCIFPPTPTPNYLEKKLNQPSFVFVIFNLIKWFWVYNTVNVI
ncbi:UNVERIFIED_CONTAM: hypothetical protein FKN15_049225 [Acipenser sinensis]